tara:strand:- start:85 stop:333 length:249 start_codon:yes stop_codon:yes gene_type:complete
MIFGMKKGLGKILLREFYKQVWSNGLRHVQLQYLPKPKLTKCYHDKGFQQMFVKTRSGGKKLLQVWGFGIMCKTLTKRDVEE